MQIMQINGKVIHDKPYVIAEIGCNHNGSLERAVEMIGIAAACGVDAVKFQKRTPEKLFHPDLLAAPYDSPHSYGKTYGEHRAALDWFGWYEFNRLKCEAIRRKVDFIVTPFTFADADFLYDIHVDAIKIASCDCRNTVLLNHVRHLGMPIIVSTGGASAEDVARAAEYAPGCALLHCVSQYPVHDEDLNLLQITALKYLYPDNVIGFSSHHSGLLPIFIAYTLGARIFEVHFTKSRGDKGTDHGFSQEPQGLRKLCEDVRRIAAMEGDQSRAINPNRAGFVTKFGKSWYARHPIAKGDIITAENLTLLAPAAGAQPYELHELAGQHAIHDINALDPVKLDDVG